MTTIDPNVDRGVPKLSELSSRGYQVIEESVTLRYRYAVGKTAGVFLQGLRDKKILASHCSHSGMTYLPPREYCERTFERCDKWVESSDEGVIEASTIVVRGFEGKRPPPAAIAFVRLDGVDSAIANYIDGVDLTDIDNAMKALAPGVRVRVHFVSEPEGNITDFSFHLIDV